MKSRITDAVIADRIASRILGKEFPTRDALEKYMKEHPAADRRNHWLKTERETERPKAIEFQKKKTEQVRGESAVEWKRQQTEMKHAIDDMGVPALVTPAMDVIGKFTAEELSDKTKKKELKARLASDKTVTDIAFKLLVEPKDVVDSMVDFAVKGGAKDTKVDLGLSLKGKAELAYQNRAIGRAKAVLPIPDELRGFLPDKLGFKIRNDAATELVDMFGNKEKTMETKIEEQRLILLQRNEMVDKVKKDMDSDDEKTRLVATAAAIGLNTGIRTGNKKNRIRKVDRKTGKVTTERTFGATTLLVRHVTELRDDYAKLDFKGKKGSRNIAEITDKELVGHLRDLVSGKEGKAPIFVTKSGEKVTGRDVNKYLEGYGITFTDFRKLKGTEEVYEDMKAEMEGMYRDLAEAVDANRDKAKKMVVDALQKRLEKVFAEAQKKLSHQNVEESVSSYVNPMVVLNMLSTGKMADDLEEAIERNDRISFNLDAILDETQRRVGVVRMKVASDGSVEESEEEEKPSKPETTMTELLHRIRELMRSIIIEPLDEDEPEELKTDGETKD